jgi:hypothetical protein
MERDLRVLQVAFFLQHGPLDSKFLLLLKPGQPTGGMVDLPRKVHPGLEVGLLLKRWQQDLQIVICLRQGLKTAIFVHQPDLPAQIEDPVVEIELLVSLSIKFALFATIGDWNMEMALFSRKVYRNHRRSTDLQNPQTQFWH